MSTSSETNLPAKPGTIAAPNLTLLKVAALSTQIVIVILVLQNELPLTTGLVLHGILCASFILLALLAEAFGRDSSRLQTFALMTLVAGPIGTAAALLENHLRQDIQSKRLSAWHDTIAPLPQNAVTLIERIKDDRLVRADAKLPQDLDGLLKEGSIRGVQAFLARVAAEGQPDSIALLHQALGSSDQRIRVQSAAVAAYLRDRARHQQMQSRDERGYDQPDAGQVITFPKTGGPTARNAKATS